MAGKAAHFNCTDVIMEAILTFYFSILTFRTDADEFRLLRDGF